MDYFLRIVLIEIFATLTYIKVWEKGTKSEIYPFFLSNQVNKSHS